MNRRAQKQLIGILLLLISIIATRLTTTDQKDTYQSLGNDSERVSRIVDGDTFVASSPLLGEVKVRMLGINTPESVDPRKKVECFGKEASEHLHTLIMEKEIILESDSSQDDKDKYGRILRYVLLPDGTLLNEKMIADGYAYEYTYHLPYRYQKEFKAAENDARTQKKGLWADAACGGGK